MATKIKIKKSIWREKSKVEEGKEVKYSTSQDITTESAANRKRVEDILSTTGASRPSVTKVAVLRPWVGVKPPPSHQAGLAGRGDLSAPGFASKSKNPGAGTISALVVAEGPALGPKSYAQALVGLAGPGQAIFSCPVNPDQAHPPLSNLWSPIGDPFFNQVFWAQESLSSQSKSGDQIGKNPKAPEAKPAKINDQPSQDGPSKIQATVLKAPKITMKQPTKQQNPICQALPHR
ncbi:hypothetical protein DSO57_1033523 [Entomophthora muscae]|uniref:Uncharacterized protein n=1 Tax=Entomophthora muscae TaxID=34485 RepID=A0ACC2UKK3_9FUNG|nr:hypothetical protein DSO57_1033523 [Entomophthora muscae]